MFFKKLFNPLSSAAKNSKNTSLQHRNASLEVLESRQMLSAVGLSSENLVEGNSFQATFENGLNDEDVSQHCLVLQIAATNGTAIDASKISITNSNDEEVEILSSKVENGIASILAKYTLGQTYTVEVANENEDASYNVHFSLAGDLDDSGTVTRDEYYTLQGEVSKGRGINDQYVRMYKNLYKVNILQDHYDALYDLDGNGKITKNTFDTVISSNYSIDLSFDQTITVIPVLNNLKVNGETPVSIDEDAKSFVSNKVEDLTITGSTTAEECVFTYTQNSEEAETGSNVYTGTIDLTKSGTCVISTSDTEPETITLTYTKLENGSFSIAFPTGKTTDGTISMELWNDAEHSLQSSEYVLRLETSDPEVLILDADVSDPTEVTEEEVHVQNTQFDVVVSMQPSSEETTEELIKKEIADEGRGLYIRVKEGTTELLCKKLDDSIVSTDSEGNVEIEDVEITVDTKTVGAHVIVVSVTDLAGNNCGNAEIELNVVVDSEAPVFIIGGYETNYTYNKQEVMRVTEDELTLTVDVESEKTTETLVKQDGTEIEPAEEGVYDFSLNDGLNTIVFTVTDEDGNSSEQTCLVYLTEPLALSDAGTSLQEEGLTKTYSGTSDSYSLNLYDYFNEESELTFDSVISPETFAELDSNQETGVLTISDLTVPEGGESLSATITVTAENAIGEECTLEFTFTYERDNIQPSIGATMEVVPTGSSETIVNTSQPTFDIESEGTYSEKDGQITATIYYSSSETGEKKEYATSVYDTENKCFPKATGTVELEDGIWYFTIETENEAGGTKQIENSSRTITIDTVPPEIIVANYEENYPVGESDAMLLTADTLENFKYNLGISSEEGTTFVIEVSQEDSEEPYTTTIGDEELPFEYGRNIVTIEATDIAGNSSEKTLYVYLDDIPYVTDYGKNDLGKYGISAVIPETTSIILEYDDCIKDAHNDIDPTKWEINCTKQSDYISYEEKQDGDSYYVEFTYENTDEDTDEITEGATDEANATFELTVEDSYGVSQKLTFTVYFVSQDSNPEVEELTVVEATGPQTEGEPRVSSDLFTIEGTLIDRAIDESLQMQVSYQNEKGEIQELGTIVNLHEESYNDWEDSGIAYTYIPVTQNLQGTVEKFAITLYKSKVQDDLEPSAGLTTSDIQKVGNTSEGENADESDQLPEGKYIFTIQKFDATQQTGWRTVEKLNVIVDRENPTLELSSVTVEPTYKSTTIVKSNPTFKIEFPEGSSDYGTWVQIYRIIDSEIEIYAQGEFTEDEFNLDYQKTEAENPLADGTYTFYVRTITAAGVTEDWDEFTTNVTIDRTAADLVSYSIDKTSGKTECIYDENMYEYVCSEKLYLNFIYNGVAEGDEIHYKHYGTSEDQIYDDSEGISLDFGSQYFYFWVKDAAGNEGTLQLGAFTKNHKPTLTEEAEKLEDVTKETLSESSNEFIITIPQERIESMVTDADLEDGDELKYTFSFTLPDGVPEDAISMEVPTVQSGNYELVFHYDYDKISTLATLGIVTVTVKDDYKFTPDDPDGKLEFVIRQDVETSIPDIQSITLKSGESKLDFSDEEVVYLTVNESSSNNIWTYTISAKDEEENLLETITVKVKSSSDVSLYISGDGVMESDDSFIWTNSGESLLSTLEITASNSFGEETDDLDLKCGAYTTIEDQSLNPYVEETIEAEKGLTEELKASQDYNVEADVTEGSTLKAGSILNVDSFISELSYDSITDSNKSKYFTLQEDDWGGKYYIVTKQYTLLQDFQVTDELDDVNVAKFTEDSILAVGSVLKESIQNYSPKISIIEEIYTNYSTSGTLLYEEIILPEIEGEEITGITVPTIAEEHSISEIRLGTSETGKKVLEVYYKPYQVTQVRTPIQIQINTGSDSYDYTVSMDYEKPFELKAVITANELSDEALTELPESVTGLNPNRLTYYLSVWYQWNLPLNEEYFKSSYDVTAMSATSYVLVNKDAVSNIEDIIDSTFGDSIKENCEEITIDGKTYLKLKCLFISISGLKGNDQQWTMVANTKLTITLNADLEYCLGKDSTIGETQYNSNIQTGIMFDFDNDIGIQGMATEEQIHDETSGTIPVLTAVSAVSGTSTISEISTKMQPSIFTLDTMSLNSSLISEPVQKSENSTSVESIPVQSWFGDTSETFGCSSVMASNIQDEGTLMDSLKNSAEIQKAALSLTDKAFEEDE